MHLIMTDTDISAENIKIIILQGMQSPAVNCNLE